MVYSVFISHSNAPSNWDNVQVLERWLIGIGIRPLLARRSLQPEPVADKVEKMIGSADAVFVLWTPEAMASGFVNQEIGFSYKRKPVIVLRDPKAPTTGFAYGFDTIELVPERVQEEFEKLRQYLLRKKSGKENAELVGLVVSGVLIVGLALGLGVLLLSARGK